MGDTQVPQSPIDIVIDTSAITNNPHERKNVAKDQPTDPSSVLTRFHAGYFRICLSFGAQVLLWSTLSEHVNETDQAIRSIFGTHITLPSIAFLLLWWTSLCTLILLSSLYVLRCVFHFRLVKAEFSHHIGINYLFAPWISWLLLLQSTPLGHHHHTVAINFPYDHIFTWALLAPIVILDIKIYGQWFTAEKRFLSVMANPTSQLSVLGNLVSSWALARMGWRESAVGIFTLGLAHYLVVFVTLYQRLSGASPFPATLRPSFFLFVAAPSAASLAWSSISWSFGMPCKMLFFLSMFLFVSLICRPTLFKKSMKRYNVAWWGYSFPLTFLSLASAEYARQVKGVVPPALMVMLSVLSVLVFLGIMLFTAANTDTLLRRNMEKHENDFKI